MKRRYVLGVVGAAGASVAGCIGDEDSPDAECETEVIGGDDGTVIQQAMWLRAMAAPSSKSSSGTSRRQQVVQAGSRCFRRTTCCITFQLGTDGRTG